MQLTVLRQRPAASTVRLDALGKQRRAIEIVERHVGATDAHWRARDCVDKGVAQLYRRALIAATPAGSTQVDDAEHAAWSLADAVRVRVVRAVLGGVADLEVEGSAIVRDTDIADAYASGRGGVACATEVAAQERRTVEADVDGITSAQLTR